MAAMKKMLNIFRIPLSTSIKFLILCYKLIISPFLPASCKFYPSCSNYALEAINQLPPERALWLILKRLLRCNPFSKGGYDPVPENGFNKINS